VGARPLSQRAVNPDRLTAAVDSGFARADAQADFARQRRRRALSRIGARLRQEPDDVSVILPFDEVVAALGSVSEHDLGLQEIRLDSVGGTVDRDRTEFDRSFLPVSPGPQERWQRIAAARRRGATMPPIDVYRVGEIHFVKDGHHRVSVARAMGDETIEARVVEVRPGSRRGRSCGSVTCRSSVMSASFTSASRCLPRHAPGSSSQTSGDMRNSPRSSRRGGCARATIGDAVAR
jgi:hypothetical protein